MNNSSYREVLQRRLGASGLHIESDSTHRCHGSLAKWRWQSLVQALSTTERTYVAFKEGFSRHDYRIRNDTQLEAVCFFHENLSHFKQMLHYRKKSNKWDQSFWKIVLQEKSVSDEGQRQRCLRKKKVARKPRMRVLSG